MVIEAYKLFKPSQLDVPYTFLSPADWQPREILENGIAKIFVAGPQNKANSFSASLMVRISTSSTETTEDTANSFIEKYHSAFKSKLLGMASGILLDNSAVELEVGYYLSLPLNSVNPIKTGIRERHIFFNHQGKSIELLYAAPEENYYDWLEAFRILVYTFASTKKTHNTTFKPLIPEATLREVDKNEGGESGEKSI